RGRDDPPGRTGRNARTRPSFERDGERVLHRFLRQIQIAEVTPEYGHRSAVLLTKHSRDIVCGGAHHGHQCEGLKGRTSTASPWSCPSSRTASARRPAHLSAASRSCALITMTPPTCSLPSAYGPSVVTTSPCSCRTTVADSIG